MANRRQFLTGLLAAGLVPRPTWADAGSPAYLAAAARPDGSYALCGLGAGRDVLFQIHLPDRGHAAAAHPTRPEAVAFARRPGTFAIVLDCRSGAQTAILSAPEGRHFYGHGAFSADGHWLYTTENDYEAGEGRIGVWDATRDYARADEFASGGVGPHDIKRLPGSDVLVVANGGIETHPDTGRTKLNIPVMAPNLTYVADGQVVDTAELGREWYKNSIRHLAVAPDGLVAFGMQWEGADGPVPVVGLHRRGEEAVLLDASDEAMRQMQGYVGSIALDAQASKVAVTSPRGGVVQVFDVAARRLDHTIVATDASGIAPGKSGFVATSGLGAFWALDANETPADSRHDLAWDNHLVPISNPA